jgi:hypothetical protein
MYSAYGATQRCAPGDEEQSSLSEGIGLRVTRQPMSQQPCRFCKIAQVHALFRVVASVVVANEQHCRLDAGHSKCLRIVARTAPHPSLQS